MDSIIELKHVLNYLIIAIFKVQLPSLQLALFSQSKVKKVTFLD